MKKILAVLALLAFATSIDAVVSKGARTARKGKISDEALLGQHGFTAEAPGAHDEQKEKILRIREDIKDSHERINEEHRKIAQWTKELTQLEVMHNHYKASKPHGRHSAEVLP